MRPDRGRPHGPLPPPTLGSIEALAAAVEGMRGARPAGSGRLIVGLAGAPGAGKSTAAAALVRSIPSAVVLPMDGFHLPQVRLVELGRRDRMGAADTFDVEGFVAVLREVADPARRGRYVFAPGFDRGVEEAVPDDIVVLPELRTPDGGAAAGHDVVIVEGNYLLLDFGGWGAVRPLLDLAVGVVIDDELRRSRLVARHIASGKSEDAALAWAHGPDERNAVAIAATLDRADCLLAPGRPRT